MIRENFSQKWGKWYFLYLTNEMWPSSCISCRETLILKQTYYLLRRPSSNKCINGPSETYKRLFWCERINHLLIQNNFLSSISLSLSLILSTVGTNHYRFSTRWFWQSAKLLFWIFEVLSKLLKIMKPPGTQTSMNWQGGWNMIAYLSYLDHHNFSWKRKIQLQVIYICLCLLVGIIKNT